jgi:MFS family permease
MLKPARRLTGQSAFYTIVLGQLFSLFGSGLTGFALSVWIFQETGSTLAYGAVLVMILLPITLGSLVSGPLIDRWDRRKVLLITDTISACGTLAIAALHLTGNLQLWHIYLVLFTNGLATSFQFPAQQAVIPLLVEQSKLTRAAGIVQLPDSFSTIVAPLVAGALLDRIGLGGILLIDVITYFIGVFTVYIVQIPPVQAQGRKLTPGRLWAEFTVGLTYLKEARPFLYMTGYITLMVGVLGAYQATYAPMILNLSDGTTLGAMNTVIGVGTLLGTALLSVWNIQWRMRALLISGVVMGVGGLLAGFSSNLIWIGAALFLAFGASPFLIGVNRALYQLKMAPEILGRVFAFRLMVGTLGQILGVIVSSVLAAQLPVERPIAWTLSGFGALFLVGTLVASRLPPLRDLETLLPDNQPPAPPA